MFRDFDFRAKVPVRQRRGFKFHEKGKFEQLAQRLRAKVTEKAVHWLTILNKYLN